MAVQTSIGRWFQMLKERGLSSNDIPRAREQALELLRPTLLMNRSAANQASKRG